MAASSSKTPTKKTPPPKAPARFKRLDSFDMDDFLINYNSALTTRVTIDIIDYELYPLESRLHGYLSMHETLVVTTSSGAKLRFFVKSIGDKTSPYEIKLFESEYKFYKELRNLLTIYDLGSTWAPECYLAKPTSIVLEDLRVKGYTMVEELSIDHVKTLLACVAKMHAGAIIAEDRLEDYKDLYAELAKSSCFKEKTFVEGNGPDGRWLKAGLELCQAIARSLNMKAGLMGLAYKLTMKRIRRSPHEQNVFCHCDLWTNNVMFKTKTDEDGKEFLACKLLDFQMLTYTNLGVDLAEIIHLHVPKETRKTKEKELIEHYYKAFMAPLKLKMPEDKLKKLPTLDTIKRFYEDKRICGLVVAAQFFPIALLSDKLKEDYSANAERLRHYMYEDRKEFVLHAMETNPEYKKRLEEAVGEVIEYMENLDTATLASLL